MVQPRRKDAGLEGKVDESPKRRRGDSKSSIEKAFERFGFKVSKAEPEYGIDPAVVLRSREGPDGTKVYLCYEERKDGQTIFYTLTVSKRTDNWKEIREIYRSD